MYLQKYVTSPDDIIMSLYPHPPWVRASDISRSRGAAKFREIHKNTQNTAKFVRNLIKYMSVQQF